MQLIVSVIIIDIYNVGVGLSKQYDLHTFTSGDSHLVNISMPSHLMIHT